MTITTQSSILKLGLSISIFKQLFSFLYNFFIFVSFFHFSLYIYSRGNISNGSVDHTGTQGIFPDVRSALAIWLATPVLGCPVNCLSDGQFLLPGLFSLWPFNFSFCLYVKRWWLAFICICLPGPSLPDLASSASYSAYPDGHCHFRCAGWHAPCHFRLSGTTIVISGLTLDPTLELKRTLRTHCLAPTCAQWEGGGGYIGNAVCLCQRHGRRLKERIVFIKQVKRYFWLWTVSGVI